MAKETVRGSGLQMAKPPGLRALVSWVSRLNLVSMKSNAQLKQHLCGEQSVGSELPRTGFGSCIPLVPEGDLGNLINPQTKLSPLKK